MVCMKPTQSAEAKGFWFRWQGVRMGEVMWRLVRTVGRWVGATLWALLVVCSPVLMVGAWGSSYVLGDWVHYYDPGRPLYVHVFSFGGRLDISWARTIALYPAGWDSSFRSNTYVGGSRYEGAVLGFYFERTPRGARLQVPYWFLMAVISIPAGFALKRRWRRRRAARWVEAGRCAACGYDVRASPGRCPECGAATPARSAQIGAEGVGGELRDEVAQGGLVVCVLAVLLGGPVPQLRLRV